MVSTMRAAAILLDLRNLGADDELLALVAKAVARPRPTMTSTMHRVSRYVHEHPRATIRDINGHVAGNEDRVREARRRLVAEGYLEERPAPRGRIAYVSLRPYPPDAPVGEA